MSTPPIRPSVRRLPNGVTVCTLPMPWVHSAFLGATVRAGSAYETSATHGASHFLEHLHCATTKRFRDERAVLAAIEALGGDFDAGTSEDYTSYGMSLLPDRVLPGIDLLAEILTGMVARPEGVRTARRLILDDLRSTSPAEARVVDACKAFLWGRAPLARSVIGTRSSLRGLDGDRLDRYDREAYRPGNLVITLAGHYPGSAPRALGRAFSPLRGQVQGWTYRAPGRKPHGPSWFFRSRKGEPTVELLLMFRAFPFADPRLIPLTFLEYILGQSSERLSVTLRMRKNPIYTYFCETAAFREAGVFSLKARVPGSGLADLAEAMVAELLSLGRDGVTAAEMELARTWYRRQLTFALDSPDVMAGRLGLAHVYARPGHPSFSLTREMERVRILPRSAVHHVIREVLRPENVHVAVVGKVSGRFRRSLEAAVARWVRVTGD
ncbi:MAG: insulinase family protein [Planctomycetes bacterium]|nr:insulinase family protein [Planctomycetota bacterium]